MQRDLQLFRLYDTLTIRKICTIRERHVFMKYDIVCIGMALVDSIIKGFDPNPVSASGFRAASGTLNVGGEAVNEASAASRLGMKTGILCSLGEDEAGNMICANLSRAGVDTGLIIRDSGRSTPVTTMFVNDDGTRKSITNGAHTFQFHPEQFADRYLNTRALLLGSLFRAPFDDPQVIHTVLKSAREQGIPVFADTKLPNFHFLNLDDLADSLPLIDYITPNEDEARYYTGKERPEEMAEVFLNRGVRNVIIKLGSKGCFFSSGKQTLHLPSFKIDAVDATGAGDNFLAGFASEILRGSTAEDALLFASACGAICTTAVGACTALKSRDQVLAFCRETALRE